MKKQNLGFTLVELLVVIAILAILALVGYLVMNPLELSRRGRDSGRLTDLANLQEAISVELQEASGAGNVILCNGATYPCVGRSNTDSRSSNGTGWVKANLGAQHAISVPTLPVDPSNTAAYHYTYCADNPGATDSWEIDIALESQQYIARMSSDGGNDPVLYEAGSNLSLVAPSGGSCTY